MSEDSLLDGSPAASRRASPLADNIDCVARAFLDKTRSPAGNGQHGRAASGAGDPFDRAARLPDCSVITGNARKEEGMDRGWGTRPILAASMPVRAIQKKWAPRAVLFPWESGDIWRWPF